MVENFSAATVWPRNPYLEYMHIRDIQSDENLKMLKRSPLYFYFWPLILPEKHVLGASAEIISTEAEAAGTAVAHLEKVRAGLSTHLMQEFWGRKLSLASLL